MPEEEREIAKGEEPSAASTSGADDEPELYKADDFRMYCMKVLPCSKRFCHDWTVCPYSHPGEKAKRRDPRLFSYTGIACPNMKKDQSCARGDACPYAHNVFEYWLHPTRYRTQLCNDSEKCNRKICFFAHTLEELRVPANKPFVPPEALAAATNSANLEAARKAAGASDANKAGLQVLNALLKAQPGGGEVDLVKTLQAQAAQAQNAQEQQALVDALASLLQTCGFVQDPANQPGRKSFDGVKAHAAPPLPRDDRLDLSASGKSRSDPARSRTLRAGGARGRGRHSIDLGHDLKRAMAQQTIHEDASLPTLKSIVDALASNRDFLQQQQQQQPGAAPDDPQQGFSADELAAFSAGMAAAAAATGGQPLSFSEQGMHQLQQQNELLAAAGYGGDWSGVDAGLLHSLQEAAAAQQQQQQQATAGMVPEHLALNWNRRRGSASLPGGGYSAQAAAQMRARAALSGEPWMGDAVQGIGLSPANPHTYGGGWGEGVHGLPGSACTGAPQPPNSLYSAFSEPPLPSIPDDSWAEAAAGLSRQWQAEPEGLDMGVSGFFSNRYDARMSGRPSTDSRRSSDSTYLGGAAFEYMPHCAPIDEYMRGSMESMRISMDSMRSGSPGGTPRAPPRNMGDFTDYRGSSLFAFSGPFSSAPSAANGSAFQEAPDNGDVMAIGAAAGAGSGDGGPSRRS